MKRFPRGIRAFSRFAAVAVVACAALQASLAWAQRAAAPASPGAISEEREIEIGEEYVGALLMQAKLLDNDAVQEYVNQVGRWLTSNTERPDLPWQFGVMNANETGAYPIPGGKVIVTKGMLRRLNSESELAGVLAHEIAHVVRKHQLQNAAPDRIGAINAPLDPAMEFEADRMALVIMSRAGYDASAFVAMLRNLQGGGDAGLQLLAATHPPLQQRIAQIEPLLAKLPKADRNKGRERFQKARSALNR
jgi:beta-barrel assembly-enhancing protease